jgi:putative transposase
MGSKRCPRNFIHESKATAEAASTALDAFAVKWDSRFPSISKSWRSRWDNVTPFFAYPPEIRKVIYTTNAIESINASIRKTTKKRGAFPTEDSVRKVLCLAIRKASERWTRSVEDWSGVLDHFAIVFEGRVPR